MRILLAAAILAGVMPARSLIISVDGGTFPEASADQTRPEPWEGTSLEPVWARQNVWMPWARWNPEDSSSLPRFDAYVREVALIMAIGHRPDSLYGNPPRDVSVPDLYDDSAGVMKPFAHGHPFFNALRLLRSRGIRPVIDLGPVPRKLCRKPVQGPFRWNTAGPMDYPRYYAYIKALFDFLQGPAGFTREEVATWIFQLYREPDNHEAWNPRGASGSIDRGNLEEFKKLYDHTLAGMRASGWKGNLGFGNLMVAYPGVWIFKDSWLEPLTHHLADTAVNLAPGLLRLPRIASAADTLLFSFTAYGGRHTQLEDNPRALDSIARRFRWEIRKRFPRNPLEITVGEGNLFSDQLHHRSDGSDLGAAWTAAIYKVSLDVGIRRYQQWGFASAPHASMFNEAHGLQSGPHNVVLMYLSLAEGRRKTVTLDPPDPVPAPGYADALATRSPDGAVRVLAFHYRPERGSAAALKAKLKVSGLAPGRGYSILRYRIDRDRGQYMTRWHRDLKAIGQTLQVPYDACMEYQFTPEQRGLWVRNRAAYEALTQLSPLPAEASDRAFADAQGRIERTLDMPANSVSLWEARLEAHAPEAPVPGIRMRD